MSSLTNSRVVPRSWLFLTLGLTTVLQLVVVNFWPHFESPNERARAYQALALVSRGSLEIGPEVARFGDMEDLATAGGRVFPNKAPGVLPLVVPGALLAQMLARAGSEGELRMTLVLGRLLASSLPFVVCVLLLARLTAGFPRGGPLAVSAYALGTPALAASLLLFSHALTSCLLLAAYCLLFCTPRPRWQAAAAAGFLMGWAAACEYPVAVPAAVLTLAALTRLGSRGSPALALGGGAPLALLGAYNTVCFGSPFALSAAHEAYGSFAALVERGYFGISWPAAGGLAGLLLSPSRGLVVWAPLVALSVVGALARPHWPEGAWARLALAAAPLALLFVMSGYVNWRGGWFPGPRYLLPVLPLVFVLVARGAESALERPLGRVLLALGALWGWAMLWPVVATFPFPPGDFPLPAFTLSPGLLADGIVVPSWLPPGVLAALLAALALVAGVQLLVLATPGAKGLERFVAVALLAVALMAANAAPRERSWQATLERAVIHDLYAGGPRGELETLRLRADTPARRAAVEALIERRDAAR
ncbi:MAG TPA: hypothetical protein VMT45_02815 [Thermoanaerobaculaceae bacterium]|nr:hypothetical protein [Thermoanaerobaculaceae bacterium]